MRLKFYARDGLVREPGVPPMIGVAARYLGREFVPASKAVVDGQAVVIPASNPATERGFECSPGSLIADVAIKNAKKGAFWPADKATAEACGMAFVDVEFRDGLWDVKAEKFSVAKSAKAAE